MAPAPTPLGAECRRRVAALQQGLKRGRLDAMIVFDRANTFYLTGMHCTLSYLLVTPREAIFMVDGRYIESARAQVRHCDVRWFKDLRQEFAKWRRESRAARIGFEGSTPWNDLERWREMLGGAEWTEAGELIRKLRLIKSTFEAKLIEESARLADQVLMAAFGWARAGATEMDVRNFIRAEADRIGADGLSFDSIVAGGAMSSRPHYQPQPTPLKEGELLLIDMGLKKSGYCSDITRTQALGRAPKPRLVKAYKAVLEAQREALDAVGPGVACAELDRIARDRLKARRLGAYFTHGLGHGVGIDIHEEPTLNARSPEILRPGMVITIEPGVYLPGLGGIRIEDLVLVTRTGHKVLSRTPKEFRVV